MLGVNQLDFINYTTALKGNYRKGVHKLEAILANPTHAAEFAANLGGVSVVLGVPIGKEDKNSEALLSLLLASSVADAAVYTWLGQFYEFTSWDDLLGDAGRCQEMMADPFIWRAMASSGVAVGKSVATLAGLDCGAYADMTAVAASSTAMTAVAASQTAMTAVAASQTAMAAVAASSTAMAAVIANSTALNAVVASSTAMAAIWQNDTALSAVQNNAEAWAIFTSASSEVMGKTVAILAGLNPDSYADMTAVAASSTAMAAVAASQTAMTAVASSATAVSAMAASSAAKSALQASPLKKEYSWGGNNWTANTLTAVSGSGLLLKIQITNNVGGWSLPTKTGHKVLLDGAAFTATNGYSTSDIYQQSTSAVIDESVRRYKSSINVYLYNATKITYIPC